MGRGPRGFASAPRGSGEGGLMLASVPDPTHLLLATAPFASLTAASWLGAMALFRRRRGRAPEEGRADGETAPSGASARPVPPARAARTEPPASKPPRPEYLEDPEEPEASSSSQDTATVPGAQEGLPADEPPPDLGKLLAQLDRLSEQIRRRTPPKDGTTMAEGEEPSDESDG